MRRSEFLVFSIAVALIAGCGGQDIVHDFSTPQGAILCLEDAYRAKDIDAAVRCKDFPLEARLMLEKIGASKEVMGDEIIQRTAEVLELGFRKEKEQTGFPDMSGVTCRFPTTETMSEGIVAVTEECTYADGQTSRQRVLVGKTENGWRVLNALEN
jgi:hypothetical protein